MELLDNLFKWRPAAEITPKNDWGSFQVENKQLDKNVGIKIQTITPDQIENAIGFLTQWFLQLEPSSRAAGILEDEISTQIWQGVWLKTFEQGASIIAVTDEETPTIVGALALCVVSKADDLKEELPGEAVMRQKTLLGAFDEKIDKYKIYDTEYFIQDWGLCTNPEWQRCGIATQLLSKIPLIGQHYKVPAALLIFTSKKSQSLALKAGFREYASVAYDDIKDETGKVILQVPGNESAKLMGLKIF
nr:PREDICTED: uncharacterized protein LOC109029622 [Bemisia tabaci]